MQLHHHLNIQQQELIQQLQLVQRQYLIHQGYMKPLRMDIPFRTGHTPTGEISIKQEETEQRKTQYFKNIYGEVLRFDKFIHTPQEQQLYSEQPFRLQCKAHASYHNSTLLQQENIRHNKAMQLKKGEEADNSASSNDRQQQEKHRVHDDSEQHSGNTYHDADLSNNAVDSTTKTGLQNEFQVEKQQEVFCSNSSSSSDESKLQNSAYGKQLSAAAAAAALSPEPKLEGQFSLPLQSLRCGNTEALNVEDSDDDDDMINNGMKNGCTLSIAHVNLQQENNSYPCGVNLHQQQQYEIFQPYDVAVAPPLALKSPSHPGHTYHSTAVAVAAAAINNAVVASANSQNFNSVLDIFGDANGLGREDCGDNDIRKAGVHNLSNFGKKKYFHPLYTHGVCRWPSCELALENVAAFVKHLNNEHSLDDRSTAQARVQMQVVSQLETHLQKERDRLQAMMHHLYLTKQLLSYEKRDTKEDSIERKLRCSSPNISHTKATTITSADGSPILNSANISIRKKISDKNTLSLSGGLPYMLERAGLDVQQEIQRNREFYKNADIRPPFTYASLIRQSIIESPDKQLTLNEIYNWFQNTFCYFRRNAATWKNAIRTNLSLHKCFVRYEDDFGSFWMVDDSEFVKRRHLSRGRPRKYDPSLSPNPSVVLGEGVDGEGFQSSIFEQHHAQHRRLNCHGDVGNKCGGSRKRNYDYQHEIKNTSNNHVRTNAIDINGVNSMDNLIEDSNNESISGGDDSVVGAGVGSELGGYAITCNYRTHSVHHGSISNSPEYCAGPFSPNIQNIWACTPLPLEEDITFPVNAQYFHQNHSSHNITAGCQQQLSSSPDTNLVHTQYLHHHPNLHQHYRLQKKCRHQYQQHTSRQLPHILLTKLKNHYHKVTPGNIARAIREDFKEQHQQ